MYSNISLSTYTYCMQQLNNFLTLIFFNALASLIADLEDKLVIGNLELFPRVYCVLVIGNWWLISE